MSVADLKAALGGGESMPWRHRAACADTDPELFFPGQGETSKRSKAICVDCRVRSECLEYALGSEQKHYAYGIWGGTTPAERNRIRTQRHRERRAG